MNTANVEKFMYACNRNSLVLEYIWGGGEVAFKVKTVKLPHNKRLCFEH